jgi:hypothetical protein
VKPPRFVLVSAVGLLVIFCIYIDYATFVEYYGQGPPYYGRSVNMDKWRNPLLFLVFVNATVLALIGLLSKYFRRSDRS